MAGAVAEGKAENNKPKDSIHAYRLPTEYEWVLTAGHMPKDVVMNTNYVEDGLTAVDAYAQTTGNRGGIDFWGNCWEWTSTQNGEGLIMSRVAVGIPAAMLAGRSISTMLEMARWAMIMWASGWCVWTDESMRIQD